MPHRRLSRSLALLAVLAALWLIRSGDGQLPGPGALSERPAPGPGGEARAPSAAGDEARVLRAFARRESGVVVELTGTVEAVLSDDRRGSRHQRFIVRLPSGHTLLVSHNIDLAPRIPALERGDPIEVRGQYEWNERGGVLHWTHLDPDARRPGGWIRHEGRLYR